MPLTEIASPQTRYARSSQLRKDSLCLVLYAPPADCGHWGNLFENRDVGERLLPPTWVPPIQWRQVDGFSSRPPYLMRALPLYLNFPRPSRLSRSSACFGVPQWWLSQTPRMRRIPSCPELLGALKLSAAPSKRTTSNPPISAQGSLIVSAVTTPSGFSPREHAAKLVTLRKEGAPVSAVKSFFRCASQLNTPRGVRLCYPSFSSEIRLYFIFCELKNTRPPPPRECAVLKRSAIFKPGGNLPLLRELPP